MSPSTMRVVTQRELGGPEVLQVVEAPAPEPLPTEILVRVHAAGVNPVDWKSRQGKGMAKALGEPPFTVGWDVAGVVEALGVGVSRFEVGDAVMGLPFFPRQAAGYADYVVGPARQFVRIPAGIDMRTAAATPLAGTTAWQIVHDVAGIGADDRVLVIGAAGGVGSLVVQLAAREGAAVTGVDAGEKLDYVRELGAQEVVDFREQDLDQAVAGMDVVVDFLGGQSSFDALRVLTPGGLVVSVPSGQGDGLDEAALEAGVRVGRIIVEPDRVALEGIAALLGSGDLRVTVDRSYPLEKVAEAHTAGERGDAFGKIVLDVADPEAAAS